MENATFTTADRNDDMALCGALEGAWHAARDAAGKADGLALHTTLIVAERIRAALNAIEESGLDYGKHTVPMSADSLANVLAAAHHLLDAKSWDYAEDKAHYQTAIARVMRQIGGIR